MSDDQGATFFGTVLYGGGAMLLAAILTFALAVMPAAFSSAVRYPDLPDVPQCPDHSVPPPPGIGPPACGDEPARGWRLGHMSDVAKDCDRPGHGRPWCR